MPEKIMTPVRGTTIRRGGKVYRHGDSIPAKTAESLDAGLLEELKHPQMTMKKGMAYQVDKIKYKPGDAIDQEHLKEINPQFVEPFIEKTPADPPPFGPRPPADE